MMSESFLITYRSGFVGSGRVPMTQPRTDAEIAKDLLAGSVMAIKDTYMYSTEVSAMWDEMRYGIAVTKAYPYKEKLAEMAFRHFGAAEGVGTVGTWYEAQKKSPAFGESHQRWILETLSYLLINKARRYNYDTWSFLLTAGSNPAATHQLAIDIDDAMSLNQSLMNLGNFFSQWGPGEKRQIKELPLGQLVLLWLRKADGDTDLAQSLHVLYGKR